MRARRNRVDISNKIDPALSDVVRVYVDFLCQIERTPNEGRLNFPGDFVGPVIQKMGWHNLSRVGWAVPTVSFKRQKRKNPTETPKSVLGADSKPSFVWVLKCCVQGGIEASPPGKEEAGF